MSNSIKQVSNSLSQLVGDYNSDSDNNDETVDEIQSTNPKETVNPIRTDWTQCIDEATGHPYYWNTQTKAVTWDVPLEYQLYLQKAIQQTDKNTWIVCYTDEQKPYYVNECTRKVSWERPTGFIEPVPDEPIVDKDNRKRKKMNRRKDVKKKKYPFEEEIDEKIELISSFSPKSSSSSDGEDQNKGNSEKNEPKIPSPLLKLVAEYNSDDDCDKSLKDRTSESITEPIFPSTIKESIVELIKTPRIDGCDDKSSDDIISESITVPNVIETDFASIITGGRSPKPNDIVLEPDEPIEREIVSPQPSNLDLDAGKPVKRKKRIEFNTSKKESIPVFEGPAELGVADTTTSSYSNFVKGNVAFVATDEGKEPSVGHTDEIRELNEILDSKLKFLCTDRPEVSGVQAIRIQLETLIEAYDCKALKSDYILKWLKEITGDLQGLEDDAAPDGWKCLWHRQKSQYYYENRLTGTIEWEYPSVEEPEDDEMDICMTPTQSDDEDEKKVQTTDNGSPIPPAPPKWDSCILSAKPEDINSELASFYSDLATMDTTIEPTGKNEASSSLIADKSTDASKTTTVSVPSEPVKKKKKKIKKSEPWRSGNLETWISKWKKAKAELDC